MAWRHGTWQCPQCRLKLGCCEGATADCFSPVEARISPESKTARRPLYPPG